MSDYYWTLQQAVQSALETEFHSDVRLAAREAVGAALAGESGGRS